MSLTITTPDNVGGVPSAPAWIYRFSVVLDNSYPTGGEVLGLQTLVGAGKTISGVICEGKTTSTGILDFTRTYGYNRVTDKLVVGTIGASPAEAANAADLSLITVEVTVFAY